MKKIRVMHCLGKLNTGGAETLVINILRNIDREKFQFNFLLFDKEKGFYDDEVNRYGSHLFYLENMTSVGIKKYIQGMIEFFKTQNPDIVHSHMDWQGGFIAYAAYKAGIKKIVVHSHANQKMFDTDIAHHLLIEINKYLIHKYSTNCLACSNEAGKSLFTKEFSVLNNGIDMNKFINYDLKICEEMKIKYNLSEDDIILGTVGGLSENKNQIFLIDLLYELRKVNPKYKLLIVGDGNYKDYLIKRVKDLNLENSVIFTGVLSHIPEIMHIFDLFLFPSIHEGLGIVAIEAQASGLSCILSDTIPKEVDLNLGLIQQISLDKNKWKNAVLKNNPVETNNNLLYNSKFNIDYTIRELINVYLK